MNPRPQQRGACAYTHVVVTDHTLASHDLRRDIFLMTASRRTMLRMILAWLVCGRLAHAQQRPIDTQDPETIGAGKVLGQVGITAARDAFYPLSGLRGDLWQLPLLGLVVGVSSIADVQISGGPYDRLNITGREPAPLADVVTATGNSTHAVDDLVFATKVRVVPETETRPSLGVLFSARLPNAKHPSGLGQDTTDVAGAVLVGKSVRSTRVAANLGAIIMSAPLVPGQQNDVVSFGMSVTQPISLRTALLADVNGWQSVRRGTPPIGTESRARLTLGARLQSGRARFDAGMFFGLHRVDPTIGVTAGVTYVLQAFTVP